MLKKAMMSGIVILSSAMCVNAQEMPLPHKNITVKEVYDVNASKKEIELQRSRAQEAEKIIQEAKQAKKDAKKAEKQARNTKKTAIDLEKEAQLRSRMAYNEADTQLQKNRAQEASQLKLDAVRAEQSAKEARKDAKKTRKVAKNLEKEARKEARKAEKKAVKAGKMQKKLMKKSS
jgi:hypothetical protein